VSRLEQLAVHPLLKENPKLVAEKNKDKAPRLVEAQPVGF
jgi:hypothetical protein